MKLNWLIICYKDREDGGMDVVHLCAYKDNPGTLDLDILREELLTDPEFEMSGDTTYEMKFINRTDNPEWFDRFGIPEESEDFDK